MKKNPFFMMLFVLALLMSCADERYGPESPETQASTIRNYVFAYKANSENDSFNTRATSLNGKTWGNGATIRIKFLNGSTIAQNKVKEVASEWLNYANLKFEYVASSENADVKIAFHWNGEQVSWSQIGTDCRNIAQNVPSMNIMLFNENDSREINSEDFSAIILREFGHVLGLVFEHQGFNAAFKWDVARVRNYFLAQAWTNAQIDQLLTVYNTSQTNYSQFDEESIMILFFPDFLTTDGKGSKWNSKLSDTDKYFINSLYPGEIVLPDRVELTYKQNGDLNSYPYTGIRIGEYYWIDNNFYHPCPAGYGGDITPGMVDAYMKAIHMDLNNKNLPDFPKQLYDLENFNKYYGRYYGPTSNLYMMQNGNMYEGQNLSSGWGAPSQGDVRQLFAMCPVGSNERLSTHDVHVALAAKHGDNPATSPLYIEYHANRVIYGEKPEYINRCNDSHYVYWYTHTDPGDGRPIESVQNIYKFNMMAGGARGNASWNWQNSLYDIETGADPYPGHYGVGQYLRQVLYGFYMWTDQWPISVFEAIDTNNTIETYHLYNIRWCRKLTDAELGYKLYINSAQTDIQKLSLTESPKAGYTELPNGYLRGFYVQYILDKSNPKYTVSDIVRLSRQVDDLALR
ncbi:MAG TPA: hypothetical protein DIT04_08695 [Dysgonomonas sp.]|nr:hypothetical protein [Dysgonomonas sp.]